FDELITDPLPRPLSETERGRGIPPSLRGKGARRLGFARRVRANAATAHIARIEAAIAARDAEALPTLFTDASEVIDHITGVNFGRQGTLGSWRVVLKAENPTVSHEMLATLGEWLVLCRMS